MKNKMIAVGLALILISAGNVFAQQFDLGDLQSDINAFSAEMAETLPFNSALGLSWSDAYIGNFPHFGVGAFAGASLMDATTVMNLLDDFDISVPFDINSIPLPAAGAEARLGGLIIPFDIGLKLGWLPAIDLPNSSFDYFMVGADIRYAIMKGNIILPKITLGVGYNYMQGDIKTSMDGGMSYDIDSYTISVSDPEVNLKWSTQVVDVKLQVSKNLFFVTPSVGIGASYSWSEAGYNVSSNTTFNGDIEDINAALESQGLPAINLGNNGFGSIIENSGWDVRLFAGLAFNILVIKIDLNAMYDLNNEIWNAGLGVRFQI
ncbi:MAG: hypothetical protein LBV20_03615 [Treponema sp.]|jgi:hypothetical protein|nr:hypothetical protein [Treponema sp.]